MGPVTNRGGFVCGPITSPLKPKQGLVETGMVSRTELAWARRHSGRVGLNQRFVSSTNTHDPTMTSIADSAAPASATSPVSAGDVTNGR